MRRMSKRESLENLEERTRMKSMWRSIGGDGGLQRKEKEGSETGGRGRGGKGVGLKIIF